MRQISNPLVSSEPCRPTLVAAPPVGAGWLHEMKHDGYRLLARKQGDRVTLWSRYGTDFTDKLPEILEVVRSLPIDDALLDGEAEVFRPVGILILSRCAPRPAAARLIGRFRPSVLMATIFVSVLWKAARGAFEAGRRRRRHSVQRSHGDGRRRDRIAHACKLGLEWMCPSAPRASTRAERPATG